MITNKLISEFLETEIQRNSKENPDQKIHFISTKEIAKQAGVSTKRLPEELRALTKERNLIFFFSLISLIGLILAIYQFYVVGLSWYVFAALSIVFFVFSLIPLFIFARLKRTVGVVKISPDGIYTSERVFTWDQLNDTFLLKIPDGENFKRYLVLITQEDTIFKYSSDYFSASDFLLASTIEKFK